MPPCAYVVFSVTVGHDKSRLSCQQGDKSKHLVLQPLCYLSKENEEGSRRKLGIAFRLLHAFITGSFTYLHAVGNSQRKPVHAALMNY